MKDPFVKRDADFAGLVTQSVIRVDDEVEDGGFQVGLIHMNLKRRTIVNEFNLRRFLDG